MTTPEGVTPTEPVAPGTDSAEQTGPDTPPGKPKRRPTTRAGRRAAGESTGGGPSGGRKPKADRAPRAPRAPRAVPLAPRIAGAHQLIGSLLDVSASVAIPGVGKLPAGVGAFGAQLVADAEAFGQAWESYAKVNPAVRDAWERMLNVSEVGAILALYGRAGFAAYAATAGAPDLSGMMTDPAGAGVPGPAFSVV